MSIGIFFPPEALDGGNPLRHSINAFPATSGRLAALLPAVPPTRSLTGKPAVNAGARDGDLFFLPILTGRINVMPLW